jgi:hypothetical protein
VAGAGSMFASPYRLESILYNQSTPQSIAFTVSVRIEGVTYTLDTVAALTTGIYVFPNVRVPFPIALPEKAQILITTVGYTGALHSAVVNWSQL